MSDMMTFPDTWEEFEKSYGFTDNEEVYTNGARLIPSFRVKQWLDHLPSAEPERAIKDCRNCKHGNYNDHWDTYFCYHSDDCNAWDKWEPSAQPELVRCKDCRWGREACGNIECWVDTNIPPEYHGYEWFCPNGERKDNG